MGEHKLAKRRFIGRKDLVQNGQSSDLEGGKVSTEISTKKASRSSRILTQIPNDILNDEELNHAIDILPRNYNFEIHKTIWHIRKNGSNRVALQMPEGLLVYACIISDILEQFCQVETVIMGDVTYGACCIDDYTAIALECDLLVHYAHSCLVPVDVTNIKTLYVFVTIDFDKNHFLATLQENFKLGTRLALLGTIQFNTAIHSVHQTLQERANSLGPDGASKSITVTVPQIRPLSKGEVLGCTAPRIESNDDDEQHIDGIVYLGDGRFHLESAMIQNPHLKAYRYDPYSRKFTIEGFDHDEMHRLRRAAIQEARRDYSSHISCQGNNNNESEITTIINNSQKKKKRVGIILGTLGRQGNPALMDLLYKTLSDIGAQVILVLLSEIFPGKLSKFGSDIDCWIQIACPRLSIDWGYAFPKPLLTPYEALIAFGKINEWKSAYPMNFYAKDGLARTKPSTIQ